MNSYFNNPCWNYQEWQTCRTVNNVSSDGVICPVSIWLVPQVVICGHSIEFNVSTDLNLYLSTEQVHLARRVLDSNLHHLLQGRTITTTTDVPPQQPADHTRPPTSLEDSGLGSECVTGSPPTEFAEATRLTVSSPPRSSVSHDAKTVAMETGDGSPRRSRGWRGWPLSTFWWPAERLHCSCTPAKGIWNPKVVSHFECKVSHYLKEDPLLSLPLQGYLVLQPLCTRQLNLNHFLQ